MSPWEILGWMVVIVVGLVLAVMLLGILAGLWKLFKDWADKQRRYLKTRNIAPAKGQRWNQEGTTLTITGIYEGRIGISTGNSSWSDSHEVWKNRVRNRKLYLINP